MCSLGKNIGYEQNGSGDSFSRPVLIIKKFNNQMFLCVPLSTKQKDFDFYYNYIDPNNQKVSVILAQIKLISVKRLKRKLYEFEEKQLKEILSKLKSYLQKIETPLSRGFSKPFGTLCVKYIPFI